MPQLILREVRSQEKQTYWKSGEMRFNFLGLRGVLVLAGSICLLFVSTPAFAAERVVLKYGSSANHFLERNYPSFPKQVNSHVR